LNQGFLSRLFNKLGRADLIFNAKLSTHSLVLEVYEPGDYSSLVIYRNH